LKTASNDAIFGAKENAMGAPKIRTTIALDSELLERAQKYTGVKERSALVHEALTALVQREAARRLALLGGTEPGAKAPPRRRFK
jgi:Arc/MetJ family transcription regulator